MKLEHLDKPTYHRADMYQGWDDEGAPWTQADEKARRRIGRGMLIFALGFGSAMLIRIAQAAAAGRFP